MNECNEPWNAPQRSVERNLVEVLDDDVIVIGAQILFEVPPRDKWIGAATSNAVDLDAAEVGARRRRFPRAAEEVHAVAKSNQPRENFPEVKLSAASLRILVVLPVEYEYPH